MMSSNSLNEHESVTIFREYLQIPTVQPNVNYSLYFNFIIFILNYDKFFYLYSVFIIFAIDYIYIEYLQIL